MNPSERFFAKLRKLTVHLETESSSLLHASQNLKDDGDVDEENGVQALYQLHSEVKALKRQVQEQVSTHDGMTAELRTFIRRCLVLKQRSTEDIDRLKKHYEQYGYRPRKSILESTEINGTKVTEEQTEKDTENLNAAEEDEEMGDGICEEALQSETPEKMEPPADQLRTPKLSDFGLSDLQFQIGLVEAEPPLSAAPVPAMALSPPPFVLNRNIYPPQPKTPKCTLRMEEDALTPRLEDFGISEYTMCWNNDFTMDLFNKKPPKTNSERSENGQKPPRANPSFGPNIGVANESLESPEPPVFCTPGFKIEKHCVPSSPLLIGQNDLSSPPRSSNCPSTPEFPAFETPFVSKLIKKEDESKRRTGSQECSLQLPELYNTGRAPSFEAPEMPKVLHYEDEPVPEMPALQSLFGSSLGLTSKSIF